MTTYGGYAVIECTKELADDISSINCGLNICSRTDIEGKYGIPISILIVQSPLLDNGIHYNKSIYVTKHTERCGTIWYSHDFKDK